MLIRPMNEVGRLMKGEPPGGPLFWLLLHTSTLEAPTSIATLLTHAGMSRR